MRVQRIRCGLAIGAGLALATLALVPGVAGASGGGGCGGPVTDAAGTTVEIKDFCFGPTILRVATGETITFVNRDRTTHTVLGANGAWGSYDALKHGGEATYGFSEAGVYPYVCTWHVGMVGAVVVGDGVGGAIDTTAAAGPVTLGSAFAGGVQDAETTSAGPDAGYGLSVAIAGIAGLLVGTAGALFGVQRLRRRRIA
jgi:plastocyanin